MGKDVIIALDFDSREKTLAFLDRFREGEQKPFVKIGMEFPGKIQPAGEYQLPVRHGPLNGPAPSGGRQRADTHLAPGVHRLCGHDPGGPPGFRR